MADRLRREKDIIKRVTDSYIQATTEDYKTLINRSSPTLITYYQLDPEKSTQDEGLETINSLIGPNSPSVYRRIQDVDVYGVNALDVMNELSERGLVSNVNGELIILPNTIRPFPGDFFTFNVEGMESHLFKIVDVQYDKITPEKYYRCSFTLSPYDADRITSNVSDDYVISGDSSDDISGNVIKKDQEELKSSLSGLVDSLIDKYEKMYYDEDTDTFLYDDKTTKYWSPYLQHFLHETKALTKNDYDFMTEIYIMDINEEDNGKFYSEETYRNSIFRNVQIKNPDISFSSNFISISPVILKQTRNLPFFCSSDNFKMITPISASAMSNLDYLTAIPFLLSNQKFEDVDHYHKVHKMDELHIARLLPYIKENDLVYECENNELEPTGIYKAIKNGEYLDIVDVSLESLYQNRMFEDELGIFYMILDYLNGNLTLNEELLTELNEFYYKKSVNNYILIPLLIYALKTL